MLNFRKTFLRYKKDLYAKRMFINYNFHANVDVFFFHALPSIGRSLSGPK